MCEAFFTINTIIKSDWFYCLEHSEITQKKIEQLYYNKTMVHFCKGWYVLKIEALLVLLSQKGGQKFKIKWIF